MVKKLKDVPCKGFDTFIPTLIEDNGYRSAHIAI